MAKCGKVDYSKSLIYKLCCKNPEIKEIYVGSTTNFIKRKYQHKSDCYNKNRNHYNHYKYQFIRNNGGFDNWDMVLIENYPCDNKRELEKKERYFMELLNATLNTKKSYLSEEEKIEQQKECVKDYRENNKDKIKEHKKNNNEKNKKKKYNCVCGSNLRLADKKRHLSTTKHLNYIRLYFNILRQNKTIIK